MDGSANRGAVSTQNLQLPYDEFPEPSAQGQSINTDMIKEPSLYTPLTPRPPKACEACRALKVGCILDESNPNGDCRRCTKRSQRCIRLPIVPRRKKKQDSRLANLEEKVETFLNALDPAQRAANPTINPLLTLPGSPGGSTTLSSRESNSSGLRIIDPVSVGMLEAETAFQMFDFYAQEIAPLFPIVVFGPHVHAATVRHRKPLLFLAILAVSAGVLIPRSHHHLTSEVWKILADRVLYTGKPSLEVIQALQVMAIHYTQHERREDYRNYHHLIHSALTMAMDLGMGKRTNNNSSRLFKDGWEQAEGNQGHNSAEVRRAWVGIYYLCST